jgi:hypothetical protein
MDAHPLKSDPVSKRWRALFGVTTALVALSRIPALSRSLWDWDEAVFLLAMRKYDVAAYHPHPPGFPLFIAAAKLVPLDGFHALQAVNLLASMLLFPAMYLLSREAGASRPVAYGSALLLAVFPNVWFFGGTGFSDVPSLVVVLFACALLLRGRGSNGALIAGAVLLAVAAGFRPQNLLIGLVPSLLAMKARPRAALAGAAAGLVILVATYAVAAEKSGGWEVYREALAHHERYIRETDSFLSETRPWLPQVADDFFLRPFRAPLLNIVLLMLMSAGLVRREKGTFLVASIFGPFLLFAWLYLDFHSSSRFSIAYMPLFAFLAASGIPVRGWRLTLGVVTAAFVVWMVPVLRVVHGTLSPPVAAISAIRLRPVTTVVYVEDSLGPFAELLLQEYDRRPLAEAAAGPQGLMLRERESRARGAENFLRPRRRLEGVARDRYFEISITPSR